MKKYFILVISFCLFIPFLSAQQEMMKVACIGDGSTEGYGASDMSRTSYVEQLKRLLGRRYIVENFGSDEATACRNTDKPYASLEICNAAMEFEPNIVIISLGTSDSQAEVWNTGDCAKNFEADLAFLCKKLEELPTKPEIYLCLPAPILPNNQSTHQPRVLEREIIPAIRRVANANRYTLVNFNLAFQNCTDCNSVDDNLFPNDKGHRLMAERAYVAIIKNRMKNNP